MNKIKKIGHTPTAHNEALKGQIASRVLMPGDPKRAKWIADKFLDNYKLVSDVRGIPCFTGKYKGVSVSVMAHGMGIPSICIYANELYAFYGVKTIYRVGSAGIYKASGLDVGDVIVANESWCNIDIEKWLKVKADGKETFKPTKSSLNNVLQTAKKLKIDISPRRVACDLFFYNELSGKEKYKMTKSYIFEMESFALYALAKKYKRNACCLLTISDIIDGKKAMTALERQTTLKNMIKIGLESIIKEK